MNKKIMFSIVGIGSIGTRHMQHINNLAHLVAVCDTDRNKIEQFAREYPGVNTYTSIDDLLAHDTESEVINICTPNGLHADQTIKALRAGKHVVCEKPMALTSNDCQRMIEESLLNQKYLFVVKQNRYNPPVQKLKELMDQNALGKIFSAHLNCFWNRNESYYSKSDWKGKKGLDGGILFTQFSHFIDLFIWLLGSVTDVRAFADNYHHKNCIEFEDSLVAIVKFESGVMGAMNFNINSFKKNMEGSITIFGEKGTIKVGGQYLNVLDYQMIDGIQVPDLPAGNLPNMYGDYQGSMSNHDKVIQNVIDVLSNKARIAVNGFDGLRTVELIQRIYNGIES